jgi:DNA-binding MarR family transcriptional regulator
LNQKKIMQKPITETISYLLAQVCKAHRGKRQELLAKIDLHLGQEMLLLRLWPGDGQTQSELAGDLCISPATMTRMLDRMAKAGLVERRTDTEDQRVSRVYLTDRGRSLREPIEGLWHELEEQSLINLTLDERILLRRLLLQVYENLTR